MKIWLIDINKDANSLILQICDNSVRQLINYLEKFKLLNKKITKDDVKEICTNISFHELENYTKYWIKKNFQKSLKIIIKIYNKGYSVLDILDSYFSYIKITDLLDEKTKFIIIKLICEYISIFNNP